MFVVVVVVVVVVEDGSRAIRKSKIDNDHPQRKQGEYSHPGKVPYLIHNHHFPSRRGHTPEVELVVFWRKSYSMMTFSFLIGSYPFIPYPYATRIITGRT